MPGVFAMLLLSPYKSFVLPLHRRHGGNCPGNLVRELQVNMGGATIEPTIPLMLANINIKKQNTIDYAIKWYI